MPQARPRRRTRGARAGLAVLAAALLVTRASFASEWEFLGAVDCTGLDANNSNPYGIAFHPTAALGYAAISGESGFPSADVNGTTVAEFDLASLEVLRTFTVGLFPTEIAVAPDGTEVYVVCSSSGTLHRIVLETAAVDDVELTDLDGNPALFPSAVGVSPDGEEIWVTTNGGALDGSDENLLRLDRVTLDLVDTVEIAGGLGRFAVRADGIAVFPVGYPGGDFGAPPAVRIYDTARAPWALLEELVLAMDTSNFPAPIDCVLSPTGERAYVSVFGGSNEVFAIDVDGRALADSVPLAGGDGFQHGLAVTPDGAHLLVTEFFLSQVRVFATADGAEVTALGTGAEPNAIGIRGGRAWVTEQGGISISVFELPGSYRRGDVNGDDALNLADPIIILGYLYANGAQICPDAGDANDDGAVALDDVLSLLVYLFQDGAPPAYPFPLAGADITGDGLDPCE
ncbi:MAG: hypothetical protein L0Z55_04560 [Planctomycetes bacterium]|nr:hypothetical protein [Planctomycetota bacterium]